MSRLDFAFAPEGQRTAKGVEQVAPLRGRRLLRQPDEGPIEVDVREMQDLHAGGSPSPKLYNRQRMASPPKWTGHAFGSRAQTARTSSSGIRRPRSEHVCLALESRVFV